MNRIHQPITLVDLGLNAGMGIATGADELVVATDPPQQTLTPRTPVSWILT
jgi:hypothetical protein